MILFLDFDGTTHPIPCKDREFFSCLPRLEKVLRDYPHVQVVISSLWRVDHTLDQLRGYFSEDMRPRIIGITPLLEEYDEETGFIIAKKRYDELLKWIADNEYKGPWVALDDAYKEFPKGCEELIPCATDRGFDEIAEAVLRIFLNRNGA